MPDSETSPANLPEDTTTLERYGIHVMNLIVTRESRAPWQANVRGVTPDRIGMFLNAPERAGGPGDVSSYG